MQFHINFYIAKYMKLQYKELKTQTHSCIQKTCTKISITNIELHTITHHFIQQKILHKHRNLHKQNSISYKFLHTQIHKVNLQTQTQTHRIAYKNISFYPTNKKKHLI